MNMDGASGTESNQPGGNNTPNTGAMSPGNNTPNTLTISSDDNKSDTVTAAKHEQEDNGDNILDTVNLSRSNNTLDTQVTTQPGNSTQDSLTTTEHGGETKETWENKISNDEESGVFYLPPNSDERDRADLDQAKSDLRVRLLVEYVSERRPETLNGSAYPPKSCYSDRGKDMSIVEITGRVVGIAEKISMLKSPFKNKYDCNECRKSTNLKIPFTEIHIRTSAHVVHDQLQAAHKFRLFFDNGDTSGSVVTLSGMSIVKSGISRNLCVVKCHTHDQDLISKLDERLIKLEDLQEKYQRNNQNEMLIKQAASNNILDIVTRSPGDNILDTVTTSPDDTLDTVTPAADNSTVDSAVCIKHDREMKVETATMRSISEVGQIHRKRGKARHGLVTSVKRGRFIPDNNTPDTVSMAGLEREKNGNNTLDTVTMSSSNITQDTVTISPGNNTLNTVPMTKEEKEKYGPSEAKDCYLGRAKLHTLLANCEKNPRHVNFVPLDQFDADHLPPGYRDNYLVGLVRALSDLTVRVFVEYLSDRRPEIFPGTDKPYPCNRNSGGNFMRSGTGCVWLVEKYSNEGTKCDCRDCLSSENPRTEFGYVQIRTAAHLVYDELEGAHTTCHLFFDRGSTPDACRGVVTLSGASHVESNVEHDTCEMTYVTHDLELIDRLEKMVDRYRSICYSYRRHLEKRRSLSPRPSSPSPTQYPEYPAIIVSHPHGCSKQVSVGYTRKPDEKSPHKDKCIYTTATCPGSGGAPVCVTGESYLPFLAVHTGNLSEDEKLNFSNYFNWQ